MNKVSDTFELKRGFSLAEVVAALVIGALVLVTMLGVYSRAQKSAAAVIRKFDSTQLSSEILQRIAEDLDQIIASGSEISITVQNKFAQGYPTARLTIQKTIAGAKSKTEQFEEIVWQSSPDYERDVNGLVLYRSHSGMALEDKLLDEKRADWEQQYPLVPICEGVTFFSVQIPKGESLLSKWSGAALPPGVVVTISFGEPFQTLTGTLDVLEEEKISRTIAIDRTRKIKYIFVADTTDEDEENEQEETADDDQEDEELQEDEEAGQQPEEAKNGEKDDMNPEIKTTDDRENK